MEPNMNRAYEILGLRGGSYYTARPGDQFIKGYYFNENGMNITEELRGSGQIICISDTGLGLLGKCETPEECQRNFIANNSILPEHYKDNILYADGRASDTNSRSKRHKPYFESYEASGIIYNQSGFYTSSHGTAVTSLVLGGGMDRRGRPLIGGATKTGLVFIKRKYTKSIKKPTTGKTTPTTPTETRGELTGAGGLKEIITKCLQQRASVVSNSSGMNFDPSEVNFYNLLETTLDKQIFNSTNPFAYFNAAGNLGASGTGSTIGSPGFAKNIMTIGASYAPGNGSLDLERIRAKSSSTGFPDLRSKMIKPELIAPGRNILAGALRYTGSGSIIGTSTGEVRASIANREYEYITKRRSGTSLSTPTAAATALLFREWLAAQGIENPPNHLIYALTLASTRSPSPSPRIKRGLGGRHTRRSRDRPDPAPNNRIGWGYFKPNDVFQSCADGIDKVRNCTFLDSTGLKRRYRKNGPIFNTEEHPIKDSIIEDRGQQKRYIFRFSKKEKVIISMAYNDSPGQGLKNKVLLVIKGPFKNRPHKSVTQEYYRVEAASHENGILQDHETTRFYGIINNKVKATFVPPEDGHYNVYVSLVDKPIGGPPVDYSLYVRGIKGVDPEKPYYSYPPEPSDEGINYTALGLPSNYDSDVYFIMAGERGLGIRFRAYSIKSNSDGVFKGQHSFEDLARDNNFARILKSMEPNQELELPFNIKIDTYKTGQLTDDTVIVDDHDGPSFIVTLKKPDEDIAVPEEIDTEIIGGTAIRERELATGDIEYVIVYDSDEEEEGEVRYIPTSNFLGGGGGSQASLPLQTKTLVQKLKSWLIPEALSVDPPQYVLALKADTIKAPDLSFLRTFTLMVDPNDPTSLTTPDLTTAKQIDQTTNKYLDLQITPERTLTKTTLPIIFTDADKSSCTADPTNDNCEGLIIMRKCTTEESCSTDLTFNKYTDFPVLKPNQTISFKLVPNKETCSGTEWKNLCLAKEITMNIITSAVQGAIEYFGAVLRSDSHAGILASFLQRPNDVILRAAILDLEAGGKFSTNLPRNQIRANEINFKENHVLEPENQNFRFQVGPDGVLEFQAKIED